jgi:hypothetical protein
LEAWKLEGLEAIRLKGSKTALYRPVEKTEMFTQ